MVEQTTNFVTGALELDLEARIESRKTSRIFAFLSEILNFGNQRIKEELPKDGWN